MIFKVFFCLLIVADSLKKLNCYKSSEEIIQYVPIRMQYVFDRGFSKRFGYSKPELLRYIMYYTQSLDLALQNLPGFDFHFITNSVDILDEEDNVRYMEASKGVDERVEIEKVFGFFAAFHRFPVEANSFNIALFITGAKGYLTEPAFKTSMECKERNDISNNIIVLRENVFLGSLYRVLLQAFTELLGMTWYDQNSMSYDRFTEKDTHMLMGHILRGGSPCLTMKYELSLQNSNKPLFSYTADELCTYKLGSPSVAVSNATCESIACVDDHGEELETVNIDALYNLECGEDMICQQTSCRHRGYRIRSFGENQCIGFSQSSFQIESCQRLSYQAQTFALDFLNEENFILKSLVNPKDPQCLAADGQTASILNVECSKIDSLSLDLNNALIWRLIDINETDGVYVIQNCFTKQFLAINVGGALELSPCVQPKPLANYWEIVTHEGSSKEHFRITSKAPSSTWTFCPPSKVSKVFKSQLPHPNDNSSLFHTFKEFLGQISIKDLVQAVLVVGFLLLSSVFVTWFRLHKKKKYNEVSQQDECI